MVTLICSTGVGALFHNVKKFEDRQGRMMLISAKSYPHELLETFAGEPFLTEHVFPDWKAVENVLDAPERTHPTGGVSGFVIRHTRGKRGPFPERTIFE